jgi:hypothetical protein
MTINLFQSYFTIQGILIGVLCGFISPSYQHTIISSIIGATVGFIITAMLRYLFSKARDVSASKLVFYRKLRNDLYHRIIKNWESSLTAVLILFGFVEWKRQDISTDDFVTYLTTIATIIALLHKKRNHHGKVD